jgi:uncharacterized Fe-S cluster protein YjdI
MEKQVSKEYSNGEVTIVWKPDLCQHSTICWKQTTGLPEVFNPKMKPWIDPKGASTQKIVEQVKKCPSRALSYYYNDGHKDSDQQSAETKIEALPGGPLLIYGNVSVKDSKGNTMKKSNVTAFCRCGNSGNKPYCDGSHVKHNFEG